jgi:hypothetical protein
MQTETTQALPGEIERLEVELTPGTVATMWRRLDDLVRREARLAGRPYYLRQPGAIDPAPEHRCTVCGQSAPFGYGVSLRHGREGEWYCAAHRGQAR